MDEITTWSELSGGPIVFTSTMKEGRKGGSITPRYASGLDGSTVDTSIDQNAEEALEIERLKTVLQTAHSA